jgi:hypothetical protein
VQRLTNKQHNSGREKGGSSSRTNNTTVAERRAAAAAGRGIAMRQFGCHFLLTMMVHDMMSTRRWDVV